MGHGYGGAQAPGGEVSRGWDERTQGREGGKREGSRVPGFLALQGPDWEWWGVSARACPTLSDSSLALRAPPRSDIRVFRASTYLLLFFP